MPGGPASGRGPAALGPPRERAPRGDCPLGTPLPLALGPGVSASQARSGYCSAFARREEGWDRVGRGGGKRPEGNGGGARLAPELGRLAARRPASRLRTVRPGLGLPQPEAERMRRPPGASPGPSPWPSRRSPAPRRQRARAGSRKPGRASRCRAEAPAAVRALSARGRDAMTHPPGIRTLHLLFIDTPPTADPARPLSPSLYREGGNEKSYLEWKILMHSDKEEFYFVRSFITASINCRSSELSLAQGIPNFLKL